MLTKNTVKTTYNNFEQSKNNPPVKVGFILFCFVFNYFTDFESSIPLNASLLWKKQYTNSSGSDLF